MPLSIDQIQEILNSPEKVKLLNELKKGSICSFTTDLSDKEHLGRLIQLEVVYKPGLRYYLTSLGMDLVARKEFKEVSLRKS